MTLRESVWVRLELEETLETDIFDFHCASWFARPRDFERR
jgi:hypothetical protein